MSKNKAQGKLPTVEELKERIDDIESYYLYHSLRNKDNAMIKHWTKIIDTYKSWIHIMENGQVFNVEIVKIETSTKKKRKKSSK